MNGLYYDPGLRQEIIKQHHERLIHETNQARLIKSISSDDPKPIEAKRLNLVQKIKPLLERVSVTGKAILIALKARNESLSA